MEPKRRTIFWVRRLTELGWILVVAGVVGEGVFEAVVSKADGELQTFNDTLLKAAEKEIALARVDAESSKATAKGFESRIAESNARVATAEARTAEASAKAEGFRADIAKANKSAASAIAEAAKANLELVRLRTPRTLSKEQRDRIITKLKAFPDTPFDLYVNTDPESAQLMETLEAVLRSAGWKFTIPGDGKGGFGTIVFSGKAGVISASGLSIEISRDHNLPI